MKKLLFAAILVLSLVGGTNQASANPPAPTAPAGVTWESAPLMEAMGVTWE